MQDILQHLIFGIHLDTLLLEYQRELEHTEFLEHYRPNPVQQVVDLDLVQQPAEQHEQIVVQIDYPTQF